MISFIIPVYNAENMIDRCISSIINQTTDENYEIIVVDDGSVDGTVTRVKKYIKEHPQIHLVEKSNGGVSSARNVGIQNAKGEYLIFCDADDSLSDDFFERIKGYSLYDLTVFGYSYVVKSKKIPVIGKEIETFDIEKVFLSLYETRLFNPVWNKIYKKTLITDMFEEYFTVGEDLLFNIEYLRNISSINIISLPLYNYTVTVGSITQSYKENYTENFSDCFNRLKSFKREIGNIVCTLIEKDYIDNIVGTISLLVNFSRYDYKNKIREMRKIAKEVERNKINYYDSSKYNKIIMLLLYQHNFWGIVVLVKTKSIIKAIVKK